MKLSVTCFLLGLVSIAAAADTTTADTRAEQDPFEGESAEDIAPAGCTVSASQFSSCYKPVTSYWNCGNDRNCDCSSALIEQTCGAKYCSADYDNPDVSFYCTGTQTAVVHTDAATSTPTSPSTTEATTTAASHAATHSSSSASAASVASSSSLNQAATAGSSGSTASPAPTATPNSGARAIAGCVLAVAAAAAGALV